MEATNTEVVIRQKPEIHHFPDYDAVLNPSYPSQIRVQELLEQVKDGIPPDWRRYGDKGKMQFVENNERPTTLGKIRHQILSPLPTRPNKKDGKGPPENHSEVDKPSYGALYSVTNEIALSPHIKAVLKLVEARDIAREFGFDEIRFCEPLLGLTSKKRVKKILFYDFLGERTPTPESLTDPLAFAIFRLLSGHGIEARDISSSSIYVPQATPSVAYLLDAERYVRNPRKLNLLRKQNSPGSRLDHP